MSHAPSELFMLGLLFLHTVFRYVPVSTVHTHIQEIPGVFVNCAQSTGVATKAAILVGSWGYLHASKNAIDFCADTHLCFLMDGTLRV